MQSLPAFARHRHSKAGKAGEPPRFLDPLGGKVAKEALGAVLDGRAKETTAVPGAGRNWPMTYDWLEELMEEVTLAHLVKLGVVAEAKVKTDRIDRGCSRRFCERT